MKLLRVPILLVAVLCSSASSAQETFEYPISIAVSEAGTYVADLNLPALWKLDGKDLSLEFKASKKFRTPLNKIRCVEFDNEGRLFAGDSATREVYRFDEGKPVPLTGGSVGIPMDIAFNSAGDMFVTDLEIQRVMKIAKDASEPEEVAQIAGCRGLFVDHEDHLWVVSTTKDQLHRIAPDGKAEVIVKDRPFQFPHTVVVNADLTAYVCDGYAKTIWRIPQGGEPAALVKGEPFVNPVGMALHRGKIYVADPRATGVYEIDMEGKVTPLVVRPIAEAAKAE